VLQRLDGSGQKRGLFSGHQFFNPRFSPDGSHVIVSESRAGGGHVWIVPTAGGKPRDLGRGNQPAWHPDGKRLLLTRFENDGYRHTSSSLFLLDLSNGTQKRLAKTHEHIILHPSFSPDGSWIAFAEERSGDVMLAPLPKAEAR
jgi:Tol biopolymer transport system component